MFCDPARGLSVCYTSCTWEASELKRIPFIGFAVGFKRLPEADFLEGIIAH